MVVRGQQLPRQPARLRLGPGGSTVAEQHATLLQLSHAGDVLLNGLVATRRWNERIRTRIVVRASRRASDPAIVHLVEQSRMEESR